MKRIFLTVLIASVSVSAVVGIAVILIGNFGDFEMRVLATTFTVACASILGLACGAAYESDRGKVLPLAGIALAIISGVSWFVIIWSDRLVPEYFAKSVMSTTLLATALAHLSLVSLARLDSRFRWAVPAVFITIAALCGLVLSLIWFTDSFDSDITFRALGVLSIIGAAMTIVIPIFHKLSLEPEQPEIEEIDAEIADLKARIAELEEKRRKVGSGESGESGELGESGESGESGGSGESGESEESEESGESGESEESGESGESGG
jgi:hypothetical protein